MTTLNVTFPAASGWTPSAEASRAHRPVDRPGGEGSAPSPFDLFLASIATCAGFYVKGYCDTRALSTEGLELRHARQAQSRDANGCLRLALDIRLPEGFPERHRDGVRRAADLCAVKKHLQHPPAFKIRVSMHVGSPVLVA